MSINEIANRPRRFIKTHPYLVVNERLVRPRVLIVQHDGDVDSWRGPVSANPKFQNAPGINCYGKKVAIPIQKGENRIKFVRQDPDEGLAELKIVKPTKGTSVRRVHGKGRKRQVMRRIEKLFCNRKS